MQVAEAPLDTDNLKLAQLGEQATLEIALRLEALLLTGTCIDITATQQKDFYPRGTQLVLGSVADPAGQDTLVMSNLGYLQLKSQPGWSARASLAFNWE